MMEYGIILFNMAESKGSKLQILALFSCGSVCGQYICDLGICMNLLGIR